MKVTVLLSVLLCWVLGTTSLIIPDEVPSLLSVIYSNIPTLKKGTDSRIGWGFRLGDRADFQFLVELGPQTNTEPLANQGDKSGGSKREALETLANTLYAQNQELKKIKTEQQALEKQKLVIKEATLAKNELPQKTAEGELKTNTQAAEWLKNWRSALKSQENKAALLKPKPGLGIGEIDAKSVLPAEDGDEAEEKINNEKITTPSTTTSKEDALDNVDLE